MNRTGKMVFTYPVDDDRLFVRTIKRGLSFITETDEERDVEFPENEPIDVTEKKIRIQNLSESVPEHLHRRTNEFMLKGWRPFQPQTMDGLYYLRCSLDQSPRSIQGLTDAITSCGGSVFANNPEIPTFWVLQTCLAWHEDGRKVVLELVADRDRFLLLWLLLGYGIKWSGQVEIWGRNPIDPGKRIASRRRKEPLASIQSNIDWMKRNLSIDNEFKRWMVKVGFIQRRNIKVLPSAFPSWQFAM